MQLVRKSAFVRNEPLLSVHQTVSCHQRDSWRAHRPQPQERPNVTDTYEPGRPCVFYVAVRVCAGPAQKPSFNPCEEDIDIYISNDFSSKVEIYM